MAAQRRQISSLAADLRTKQAEIDRLQDLSLTLRARVLKLSQSVREAKDDVFALETLLHSNVDEKMKLAMEVEKLSQENYSLRKQLGNNQTPMREVAEDCTDTNAEIGTCEQETYYSGQGYRNETTSSTSNDTEPFFDPDEGVLMIDQRDEAAIAPNARQRRLPGPNDITIGRSAGDSDDFAINDTQYGFRGHSAPGRKTGKTFRPDASKAGW